ncbi:hypothetical protein IWX65_001701 [Arthrobacter sp. CAN_A214]|uniref:hypothetical protein n=1 Tax=Arthrobacter sp. CAN_A214 TaxID=2787720 RepID=UPI0018CB4B8C
MTSPVGEPTPDPSGAAALTARPGLSGAIALLSVESLDAPGLTAGLAELGTLVSWAQAEQAEVMHLLERRFQDDLRHNGLEAKAEQRGRRAPDLPCAAATSPITMHQRFWNKLTVFRLRLGRTLRTACWPRLPDGRGPARTDRAA